MSFYRLAGRASRVKARYDPLKWSEIKKQAFCPLTLGERVTFGKGRTGVCLLGTGFSSPEEWGCWTDGSEATLNLRLPRIHSDLELVIEAMPFAPQVDRFAEISLNEKKIALWDVGGTSSTRFTTLIKKSSVKTGQFSVIKLKFNKTFSPASLGTSSDSRELGLGLVAMTLSEVPTGQGQR